MVGRWNVLWGSYLFRGELLVFGRDILKKDEWRSYIESDPHITPPALEVVTTQLLGLHFNQPPLVEHGAWITGGPLQSIGTFSFIAPCHLPLLEGIVGLWDSSCHPIFMSLRPDAVHSSTNHSSLGEEWFRISAVPRWKMDTKGKASWIPKM